MNFDGFEESLRAAFGRDIPVRYRQNNSGVSVNFSMDDIQTLMRRRPGTQKLKELQEDRSKADAFLSAHASSTDREDRFFSCDLLRGRAEELRKRGQYEDATLEYEKATEVILGRGFVFPLPNSEGLRNEVYINLGSWESVVLMECCNGMAQCLIELKSPKRAVAWLEEVNTLFKNGYFSSDSPLFEWMGHNPGLKEYFAERLIAYKTAAEIFYDLGNTGMAVVMMTTGQAIASGRMPSHLDPTKSLAKIMEGSKLVDFIQLRHPDPQLVPKIEIKDETMQVYGSWKKVKLKKTGGIPSRMGFASFVYQGHLYVAGGQQSAAGPFHRDIWCLDLSKLDGWHQLSPYPIPTSQVTLFRGLQMAVHKDKAYLFTGRAMVDYFNLTTRKWGTISTKFKKAPGSGVGRWLYPGNDLTDYTMQMVNGRLYVFGGTHPRAAIGCNLFVVLDIETCEWTHLSGTVDPKQDYSCPGPRKWPTSWVNKEQDTIYILHGMADRAAAKCMNQANGADDGHACEDFWSWNILHGKWKQERINGNPPCPRAEQAYTFNPNLDRAIVFGGYHPDLTTVLQGKMYTFTYFADTFMFDASTFTWTQILTRGFPTYRAESQLLSDPSTGKTYLFGGFTNADYIADKKHLVTRTFADLWELKINMPGGGFEDVDLEEEKRTARAGPWQRCFACGGAGLWMKCGGTCKGRVYFCDPQCQKEGWREHKTTHHCRKVS